MNSIKLNNYFNEYQLSHNNKVNIIIHKFAIPFIVFHILAMAHWIVVFKIDHVNLTLAEFALIPVAIFYFNLNKLYAIIMLLFSFFCIYISQFFSVGIVWGIAFFAWFFQLLGHVVWEKKSPAFSKNFIQILIGPLYFIDMFLGVFKK